ncbi:hypothetical protein M3Y95_00064300 [Aphelenchoides besseyi]|nr:hypothetical protein M3Y95_00064300 [Aphelenchoides besseyi]
MAKIGLALCLLMPLIHSCSPTGNIEDFFTTPDPMQRTDQPNDEEREPVEPISVTSTVRTSEEPRTSQFIHETTMVPVVEPISVTSTVRRTAHI